MSTSNDGVTNDLIARLEAEAEFVEVGNFTVDLARAEHKLAKYRMAEAQAFVLLLVEVAHLLDGCAGIHFEFGLRGTEARLDGVSLTRQELRTIRDDVFLNVDQTQLAVRRRSQARRSLAVALNTTLGLPHRGVELVCVDDTGERTRLRFDAQGQASVDTEGTVAGVEPCLHFKIRDAGGLRARSQAQAARALLLRTRCEHASVPVRIGTEVIDQGFRVKHSVDPVVVRDEDNRVVACGGWLEERYGQPSLVVHVANGVTLGQRSEADWRQGIAVVVEVGDLRRDLSSMQLIRDAAYEARIAHLQAALADPPTRSPLVVTADYQGDLDFPIDIFPIAFAALLLLPMLLFESDSLLTGALLALGALVVFIGLGVAVHKLGKQYRRRRLDGSRRVGTLVAINQVSERHKQLVFRVPDGYGERGVQIFACPTEAEVPEIGARVYLRMHPRGETMYLAQRERE